MLGNQKEDAWKGDMWKFSTIINSKIEIENESPKKIKVSSQSCEFIKKTIVD